MEAGSAELGGAICVDSLKFGSLDRESGRGSGGFLSHGISLFRIKT